MDSIIRISEAANLGLHALIVLALEPDRSPSSVGVISSRLGVSESHLGKVLQRLARQGLVSSTRGARGGFSLACDPGETTLLTIVEALDGPLPQHGCLLKRGDCLVESCVLGGLEMQARRLVQQHLGTTTLADLVTRTGAPLGRHPTTATAETWADQRGGPSPWGR